jgi:hypothetical protein
MDYGSELGARTALTQVQFDTPLPVYLRWTPQPVIEVSNPDQATAVAAAQQATDETTRQFPLYFQRTLYGRGDTKAVAIPGTLQVETSYPILPGAAGGAVLGVGGIAALTILRKRHRR